MFTNFFFGDITRNPLFFAVLVLVVSVVSHIFMRAFVPRHFHSCDDNSVVKVRTEAKSNSESELDARIKAKCKLSTILIELICFHVNSRK